jgi:polysaccharide deacetylase family protein (PEP-CTERM system associated)
MEQGPDTSSIANGLSVDVEDYYQVQALEKAYTRPNWDSYPSRVERNTRTILDIFAASKVKGTFFTLGWIAERHPAMVREIVAGGHELASHGYCHLRVDSQSPEEFRADIRRTKAILEDIGGVEVRGYRAATFSVGAKTPWAWPVLEEEGYRYSSSIYPVARDNYSNPDAPRSVYKPAGVKSLIEVPIATVRIGSKNYPCGGGGYFRLLPYALSRWMMAKVNREDGQPALFYFHPWEVDPGQPRPEGLGAKARFRHYINIDRMERRIDALARDFAWDRMDNIFLNRP